MDALTLRDNLQAAFDATPGKNWRVYEYPGTLSAVATGAAQLRADLLDYQGAVFPDGIIATTARQGQDAGAVFLSPDQKRAVLRFAALAHERMPALLEAVACIEDILDADGDLDAMDFERYRAVLSQLRAPRTAAENAPTTGDTKYFKTIVRYEVLSADAPFEGSLSDLAYETTDGSMSGRFLPSQVVELTREEARDALAAQGSDPDFLSGLDEDEDKEEAQ